MAKRKHPNQPLYTDKRGVVRFHPNKIVQFLLDHGGHDLNEIAAMDFSDDDRIQFAQLIEYSLGGFADLGYVDNRTWAAVARKKIPPEAPSD